ncbi:hypothetical protein OpiT1DRAFT_05608 [Opitutaceae bacterium TAV1]|nr:hypothetical protein OpiT1DRAFT_05608 [Opitutaceae bacterium TAV1]
MGANVTPGENLEDALTATRINGIQDAIRALARGDNIVAGRGIRTHNSGSEVILTATTLPSKGGTTVAAPAAPLTLTLTKPAGYADPPEGIPATTPPVWVTWGHVNNIVPDNMGLYTLAEQGKKVWIKATTNQLGASNFRVLAVTIGSGDTFPEDGNGDGGETTEEVPPKFVHYLLGTMQVTLSGEAPNQTAVITIAQDTIGGNFQITTYASGYNCVASTPSTTGGMRTVYGYEWKRVNGN